MTVGERDEGSGCRSPASGCCPPPSFSPRLAEGPAFHAEGPGYRYEQEREFGLELILDGLQAHRR